MNAAMAVVIAPGSAPELELRGPLDEDALEEALAGLPSGTTTLRRHTPTHHTLHLPRQHSPAGTVADLLTTPGARPRRTPARPQASRTAWAGAAEGPAGQEASGGPGGRGGPAAHPLTGLPASARQREVLLDGLTGRPGAGLHVEQLHWRWYGPLDTGRFHAAWQRVFAQEPVLRAAFGDQARADGRDTTPRVLVHPHASPQIVRHPHGTADWHSLLVSERLRPFDLRRPGLMRIALLDERAGSAGPTRIALTYHHAMLDGWSVRLLLRAFYRAYRAEGRPTGGERRPDVRDHLRWLAGQDLAPPRAFWSRAAPPPGCHTLPGPPAAAPTAEGGGRRGRGLARERLTPSEAARLREWAAGRGAAESTALHAAWAMLLYRYGGAGALPAPAPAPAPIAFAMAVSGRGIALEGAAGIPAPLRNALPVHVEVDPAAPLPALLADLRDRALGAAAYEWASAGQIREWSGRTESGGLTQSLLVFETPQGRPPERDGGDPLWSELAAEGVRVDPPRTTSPSTPQPLVVSAHHDAEGALLLTAVNDRTRVADEVAAAALARTAQLLRAFPVLGDGTTPIGEILRTLADLPAAGAAAPAPVPPAGPRTLRAAGHPDAGTILLIPPPAAPEDCYDGLVRAYRGPRALTTVAAPADAQACLAALRPTLAAGGPLLLGCFSGGGSVAYEVAQRIAAHGWLPPLVAIAGTADGSPESVRRLARTLVAAGRPG
ncbi:condensation domain-containing protein [Streptomyces sp. NPDC051109]|uniref:condensation domain-containing protein n=1 Tax=Streptomyces sp. NPDC051109 TaxID=3365642 RepID=UPI00378DD63B